MVNCWSKPFWILRQLIFFRPIRIAGTKKNTLNLQVFPKESLGDADISNLFFLPFWQSTESTGFFPKMSIRCTFASTESNSSSFSQVHEGRHPIQRTSWNSNKAGIMGVASWDFPIPFFGKVSGGRVGDACLLPKVIPPIFGGHCCKRWCYLPWTN